MPRRDVQETPRDCLETETTTLDQSPVSPVIMKDSLRWFAHVRLERCIAVIDKWMTASRLKMNSDKSKVIWVGSRRTVLMHALPAIQIG